MEIERAGREQRERKRERLRKMVGDRKTIGSD